MTRSALIVGAGRLAVALGRGLSAAGWRVALVARSPRGRAAVRRAGLPAAGLASARDHALVLLAVPDDAVAEACRSVAPHLRRGQVVAHGAGALPLSPLAPARRRGAHPGSLHLLQALAGGPVAPGGFAALAGDAAARRLLGRAARDLGLRPIAVPERGRARYHAAAVVASNLAMALAALAAECWERAGAPPRAALPALVPLLRGAVENLAARGLPGALTGPAARGDAGTVARQLALLTGEDREIYRLLSRRLVRLARAGGLDPAKARAVARALRR
ncbi:Rossmann-like and DUF2520 domain-containing protein [Anaeromyxobacter paludicola]|uniref:DUF2520 domain-containing protein n=1 Tax=Anaeromyxobacter paludicola TaxID=2918171 RepID=A0ABN6N1Z1_9BACT|nr:Rossmann-like and DUF2520 domain-containing protein [Anaeromyxobacter paludicola]BDG07224.1 hypothetical protein AMPC_03370 [Anaeromyxobacter paludicola]